MARERPDYVSYLLRLWREDDAGKVVWRASVESSLSGERVSFASLEELFEFLRRQTGERVATTVKASNAPGHLPQG